MSLIICKERGKEISDKATACPHCGCPVVYSISNDYKYPNEEQKTEIQKREKKKNSLRSIVALIISFFGCGIFSIFGFLLAIYDLSKKDDTKEHKLSIYAIIISVLLMGSLFFGTKEPKDTNKNLSSNGTEIVETEEIKEDSTNIQNEKQFEEPVAIAENNILEKSKVNIDRFDYEIKDGYVLLKEFNGMDKNLYIQSNYYIDGKTFRTDISEFRVDSDGVEFIIFENGIEEINNSPFNSSNVTGVFFPNSMKVIYDSTLNYMHPDDGEKINIYYEGTEEEWNNIFTKYEAKSVKDAFDSSENPEEKGEEVGKAVADNLNKMLGSYESENYEYHFSFSEDDLSSILK